MRDPISSGNLEWLFEESETPGLPPEKIRWIQTVLNRAEGESLNVDGIFRARTREAVRRFQTRHGLPADGVVGSRTETALIQAGLNRIQGLPLLQVNGVMDLATRDQIRFFQAGSHLAVDGIVGLRTRIAMIAALGGGGCAPQRARIRIHVKILQAPNITVGTMLDSMRQVYGPAGYFVELASTETLELPDFAGLDVGACVVGTTTAEQRALFSHRNNVGRDEIVVYFVRDTIPPLNGCAAHPAGRPSAVVTQGATEWTLGHEVGHVLALAHVNDNDRLMTGNGTANITNPPPDLVDSEIQTIDDTNLTIDC